MFIIDFLVEEIMTNKLIVFNNCILILLLYVLKKYRYKKNDNVLTLTKKTINQLIKNNKAEPIFTNKTNLLKIKNLNFMHKPLPKISTGELKQLKKVFNSYSIGTCGPRGFYGTTVKHLEFEDTTTAKFQPYFKRKVGSIMFSNSSCGLISTISCFIKPKHNAFCFKYSHPLIFHGLKMSKSTVHEIDCDFFKETFSSNILALEFKIFVIQAVLLPMEHIAYLKKNGFRIIYVCENLYDIDNYDCLQHVDILYLMLPFNGGFAVASDFVIDYMKLSANAYVFSASLPVFLVQRNIQYIKQHKLHSMIRHNITAMEIISRTYTTYFVMKLSAQQYEKLTAEYNVELWKKEEDKKETFFIVKLNISKYTTKEYTKNLKELLKTSSYD